MQDITIKMDDGYFIYRVGAIIIHEKKLLMVKNDDHPYYYTVGGRVKFFETSEAAIKREVYEETGIAFEIDRLAFIHENMYIADFFDDNRCAEIGLYYLMKPSLSFDNLCCESTGVNGSKESLY